MMEAASVAQLELPDYRGSWIGSSRAGVATGFRWNNTIQFDAGVSCWTSKPKHLFLTHTHADHVQCLCQELLRGTSICSVYFPAKDEAKLAAYLTAFQRLVDDEGDQEETSIEAFYKAKLVPVSKGRELRINRNLIVRVVEGTHRRVCNGYSLFRETTKLKDEYKGMQGKELGELRKLGIEITNAELTPLFCFLGDTRPCVFQDHPEILRDHSIIMVESTFINQPARAVETGHMDWTELEPIMETNPQILFVLQHFSERYRDAEWAKKLQEYNQNHVSANAHIMLPGIECYCFQCQPN